MEKKINIGNKAKVCLKWNVSPTNYSPEMERRMISLMAKKYGIPEKNIRVETNYIINGTNEGLAAESVQSIHDPKFQQELMKQYIALNDIKDIDFNEIVKIDSQINSLIDYDSYQKGKRYSINWVKWSNFLSYGPDNYFDFRTLHGLVLLNGEPANKSGKSTFAYDLLHFLLFGKTNTNKAKTLGDLFNNYLPDERTVTVEGSITIDGEDYIIRRTLTRPAAGKKSKTISNKVEYYKLNPDGTEDVLPDANQEGESSTATNKIIKDALGNESDFDLIISANAKDLDSLISLTETEKGRLLSRWIGLSVIEDKDAKAREMWNKRISVGRFSDMYNKAQLETDIETCQTNIEGFKKFIEEDKKAVRDCDKRKADFSSARDALLSSKLPIDESYMKIDVVTLQASIDRIVENGKRKNAEVEYLKEELAKIGNVDYSEDSYKALSKENERIINDIASLKSSINSLKTTNSALANAEVCPTCHRKLDNVDNSKQIEENKKQISIYTEQGVELAKKKEAVVAEMDTISEKRALYQKKSQIELKMAVLTNDITSSRAEYKEKQQLLKDIQKNKDAIAKNSEIDANLNVLNANIRNEENIKNAKLSDITSLEREISTNTAEINTKKGYIVKINEEAKTEKYWKLYLQMIGKDGIGKMILRNTLPVINGELERLLGDVSDFKVEITMNDKNDIDFLLIRDGVTTRLSAASGLEKTQAALALRVVLGKMSSLSRPPFILLDEVLGTVAKENYDDMKRLYDKIAEYYDFILHICHIDAISDWHQSTVTVVKEDNISRIKNA